MPASIVRLAIPAGEFLRLYQGAVRYVVARAEDGRTIRFEASHLRRFVTADGVYGRFEIQYDRHNRFQSIRRL